MAIQWNNIPYLPLLSLRPAEMRALEELPNLTKDRLLPVIHLRPWVGSHRLENATLRIQEAYGNRRLVIAMGDRESPSDRPVFGQLEQLRQPANGFREWCRFFETNENYIPAIQYSPEVEQEELQIARLFGLDRGLVVIIERTAFGFIRQISRRIGERTDGGNGVCFVLDFGQAGSDHLSTAAQISGFFNTILNETPSAFLSVSASSFPDSFTSITTQQIYERRLFDLLPQNGRLIYSDRGSARVERQSGGGGQPNPRIDYPLRIDWNFFRSADQFGFPGYRAQAQNLMNSAIWNPDLRVWGTQMVERTAVGDSSAITSPQKATAARINIHLQLQAFYNNPDEAEETDEDWDG